MSAPATRLSATPARGEGAADRATPAGDPVPAGVTTAVDGARPVHHRPSVPDDDFHDPERAAARRANPDPYVLYLVVRRERAASFAGLLAAAAAATIRCDRAFRDDPAWSAAIAAWHAESYRKVTLRANERDWPRLLDREPHVLATDPGTGEPLVAALPVRRRSAADGFLRNLQAYALDPADLHGPTPPEPAGVHALVALAPGLGMSAGKAAAQVGHAALMGADRPAAALPDQGWDAAVRAWEAAGWPIRVVPTTPRGWAEAEVTLPSVVVTDSGITEVAPGSRTVLLVRPDTPAVNATAAWVLGRG